ncbi:MAG: PIN domain-containing protein [Hyphomicrobiales bacterium]|nr:PIN domain-containing protein [Hyphomicrobiales bacterium]MBV8826156.1 PIN domain-containing protein [Hyphomicrobiales bacterium]
MTDLLFVDTNVLIYSLDPGDPAKRAKAAALIKAGVQRRALVTSPQTLTESYRILTQKRQVMPVEAAREYLSALAPTCTAPLDPDTIVLAWQIEDRANYSWWDCLMLAAALRAGCRFFASEDLSDGHELVGMRIVNPFGNAIEAFFPS